MTNRFLPKELLFELFIDTVYAFNRVPAGWKIERESGEYYAEVSPSGIEVMTAIQKEWTEAANNTSSFPICMIKRESASRNDNLTVFYSIAGIPMSSSECALLVSEFRLEEFQFMGKSHALYLQNGDRMRPRLFRPELSELDNAFQEVFSEDPKYRLLAVTGNLFDERLG